MYKYLAARFTPANPVNISRKMWKQFCQLIIFSLIVLIKVNCLGEHGNFTALLEIVETSISEASDYVAPEDNLDMVEVDEPDVEDYGTFDFIVIGSGAAGSIVSSRLSEVSNWRVLVLEAGDYQHNPVYKILGLYDNFKNWNCSWGYSTTVQRNACLAQKTQTCKFSHGKVFGGSTGINANIYTRGHPGDFDLWAELTGDDSWSYPSVLPYFKKSEKVLYKAVDPSYHGHHGPLTTNITEPIVGVTKLAFESLHEIGLESVDLAGPIGVGVDKMASVRIGNERLSASEAFLEPFLCRPNLKISVKSFVTRIILDGDVAVGVEFVKNGTKFVATADKEVIVSAGALNSPQILMLSGIGPKAELERLNIPVVKNLPVGQHLRDQIYYFGLLIRQSAVNLTNKLEDLLKLYTQHQGPLLAFGDTIVLSKLCDNTRSRPAVEYLFVTPAFTAAQATVGMTTEYQNVYNSNNETDILVAIILLHPQSEGTVTLKSASPVDKPIIDPQFFAHKQDLEIVYEGIQEVLKLHNTTALRNAGGEILIQDSPGCPGEKYSKEWYFCNIKHWNDTPYHPSSSNKMGHDPEDSVVNSQLLVHGLENVRVVDASVFPSTTSGHSMAPTNMVAEKAADIIKVQYNEI